MKAVFLSHKTKQSSIGPFVIVFIFFINGFFGYSQSVNPKTNINEIYQKEVNRLLLSTNNPESKAFVVAAFSVHPMIDPDYSICLKDSARQLFLETRMLDKNINSELMTRFMQHESLSLPLKVSFNSTKISDKLVKKIIDAFDKITPTKEDPFQPTQYDGPVYEFSWLKDGKMKNVHINYDLLPETYEANLIRILDLISNDLKNRSFNESKYIKSF